MTTHKATFPPDSRSAAELYLAKGLAPIPLPPRSKDPGYSGWPDLRLTVGGLDEHFPRQQARNVGVLNGAPSGDCIDLDLDCPQALLAAPLLLPATGMIFGRKSAPCSHRIYRAAPSLAAAQQKYTDLDGTVLIELRGTGGLTVYPPSTHKDTGEQIAWERFEEPAPVKLADLQQAVQAVAAAALLARHWPAQGARQDASLALVGGLLRAGWAQGRVERFVEALAAATRDDEARKRVQVVGQTARKLEQEQKTTGWPKLETLLGTNGKEIVRRVREWLGMVPQQAPVATPTKKVREVAPYQPFPVQVLPSPIREYVEQGALALGCDPAYLALPALAVAASVIGNTHVIRLKRTWHEPSVVWTCIVADSGTLKTPAYLVAVAYLFRLQKRLREEFKQKLARYQEELEQYRERKKTAKEEGTDPGDPPEAPVLQRIAISDCTIEKVAEILEDNPRGILLARDELAGWLGSFKQYKGKSGGNDLPHWLEMFRAGTILVDRKTGPRTHYYVERAAVSIAGGIQPGTLARALTPEFLDAGGAARLIMAMPPKLPKRWTEAEIAPEIEQAYHGALDKLLALDFSEKDGEQVPHVLTLSPGAKEVWVAFYNRWAQEQVAVEGELAAAFSKLEAYAVRFALLNHVVGRVARGEDVQIPVERECVEAGVTLCRWCANEARRVYSILTETEEEQDTRRLVEFIRSRHGAITPRQLMRSNNRKYPTVDAAEAKLGALVDAGIGKWVEQPAGPRGGRPTRRFELCTTHDNTDTTPDDDDSDDDGPPPPPPDTTPEPSPPPPGIPVNPESSVGCVMRHADEKLPMSACGVEVAGGEPDERMTGVVSVPQNTDYLLIRDASGLRAVAAALDNSRLVGVDLETTGLDPRSDSVRLLSLSLDTIDGGTFAYLVDCFAVDPSPLWEALTERELVLHNAAFDLGFLSKLGFRPGAPVQDTMLLAQLLAAGTGDRCTLAACCERYLGRALDKEAQRSDWSGTLTADQLSYAARDAEVLVPLHLALAAKAKAAGLERVADLERRCLPALVWMNERGVPFDKAAWQALALGAGEEAARLSSELDGIAPQRPGILNGVHGWNWNSPAQVQEALTLVGCQVKDTSDESLATADHPLADLLRRFRLAGKRGSTYGTDWLKHVAKDGRVYTDWRQLGCKTGRMASSNPNLQNVPRAAAYRGCFRAPESRVLVKADYSQIELRIAAKIANEAAMIQAYQRGEDLHALTARRMTGKPEISKEERQLAKPVNFGLIYGLGANALRRKAKTDYGMNLSQQNAERYRRAFFTAYPAIQRWHNQIRRSNATETRTLTGRRVLVEADAFFGAKANYTVQGTGGDGIKLALALLWERREQVPGAFPVLAVHDEIVVEADAENAKDVAAWLKAAMVDAMAPLIEPVPVEVEVKIAETWG